MQKKPLLACLLLVGAIQTQAKACLETTEQLDPRFAGVWTTDESSAELTITAERKTLCLAALDADDGEAFEVSLPQWNGSALGAILRMPSTNWTSLNVITLDRSQGVLVDEMTTQEGERYQLIFRRVEY